MTGVRRRMHLSPWALAMAGLLGAAPAALAVESAPDAAFSAAAAVAEPAVVVGQTFIATETDPMTIVLPDGTRLVVGKGGAVTVAAYSWSAAGGTGRIELRLAPGTYQIAAGRLGPSGDIVARAGESTIRVFDATAIVAVGRDGAVRAYMTSGDRLDVACAGVVRTIDAPDVEAVGPAQGCPSAPRRVSPEQVAADQTALGLADNGDTVFALGDVSFAGGVETRREPLVSPVDAGIPGGPSVDRSAYQVALSFAPGRGAPVSEARDVSGEPGSTTDGVSFTTQRVDNVWRFTGEAAQRTATLLRRSVGPLTNRVIVGDGLVTELTGDNPLLVADSLSEAPATFSKDKNDLIYGFNDGGFSSVQGPVLIIDSDFESEGNVLQGFVPTTEGIAVETDNTPVSPFGFAARSALQSGFVSITLNDGTSTFLSGPITVGGTQLTIRNTGTPLDGTRLKNLDLDGSTFLTEDGTLAPLSSGIGYRFADNFMFQQFDERARIRRLESVRERAAIVGADPDRAQAWAALYEDSKRWERFTERNVEAFRRLLFETDLDDFEAANRINLTIDPTGDIPLTSNFNVAAVRANPSLSEGPIDYAEILSALVQLQGTEGISDARVANLLATLVSFDGKGPVTAEDVGLPPSVPELAAFGSEGIAVLNFDSNDPWFGKPTGASIVFAAGDVDGAYRRPSSPRVDRFFTSAGLTNFSDRETGAPAASGIRAFLPIESAFARRSPGGRLRDLGVPLVDSGVLLAYGSGAPVASAARRSYTDGEVVAQLAHADIGIEGAGSNQRSTFSITIGQVDRYRVDSDLLGDKGAHDAFLTARTLGSSRDRVGKGGDEQPASTFYSSPQGSTAAGGGNPDLVDAKGQPLGGTPGYFVVENFDPLEKDRRLRRGVGWALGGEGKEPRFASLRLLSATGSLNRSGRTGRKGAFHGIELSQRTPGFNLKGFAAGLSEFETAGGTIGVGFADAYRGKNSYPANLSIAARPEQNRLTATLRLTDPNGAPRTRILGGDGVGTSAYFDDRVFAARSETGASSGAHALVSAQLVTTGKGRETALPGLGTVGTNRYLAWGLYLADRTWERSDGLREHVHMGAWVAGDPTERSRYRDFTGEAEYRGPAVGNAYDGRAVSTVVGSFRNKWDFGKKTGSFDLEFDDRSYAGTTRVKEGRGFVGDDLRSRGRIGRVDGDFFGPATKGRGGARSPAAIGGQFAISGRGKEVYRASGVFFGKKCGRC